MRTILTLTLLLPLTSTTSAIFKHPRNQPTTSLASWVFSVHVGGDGWRQQKSNESSSESVPRFSLKMHTHSPKLLLCLQATVWCVLGPRALPRLSTRPHLSLLFFHPSIHPSILFIRPVSGPRERRASNPQLIAGHDVLLYQRLRPRSPGASINKRTRCVGCHFIYLQVSCQITDNVSRTCITACLQETHRHTLHEITHSFRADLHCWRTICKEFVF